MITNLDVSYTKMQAGSVHCEYVFTMLRIIHQNARLKDFIEEGNIMI